MFGRDPSGDGSQDTGLTAGGSFGGRFCCIMALMEMGVVLGDGCGKGKDTVPAHGGAWLWCGGGAAGAFGEYGEELLQAEPSDGGGGKGAGKSLLGMRGAAGFGSGAEGAEILLRGLPEGMVAVASGTGTPGGVLCAGLWALRTGVSELWK